MSNEADGTTRAMLEITGLEVHYGGIRALNGLSLNVPEGSIVTLSGANGAGKSTTLRTISGLVPPAAGSIRFDGKEIAGWPAHKIVADGLAHVPEGRLVFPELNVRENLMMGAYLRRDRKEIAVDLAWVGEFFPRLKERITQQAGTLSGGEQQMLAIGRALMGRPRCLMLDEPFCVVNRMKPAVSPPSSVGPSRLRIPNSVPNLLVPPNTSACRPFPASFSTTSPMCRARG